MRCRGDAHRSDAVKRTLLFRKVCPPDLPPGTKQRQRMHCRSAGQQHFGKMLIFRMPAQVRVGSRTSSMVSVESIGEKAKTVDFRLRRSPCGNSERGLVSECCAEGGSDSPLLPVQKPENGIIFSKPAFGPSRRGIKFCFFLTLFVGRVLPAAPNVSLHPPSRTGALSHRGRSKGWLPPWMNGEGPSLFSNSCLQ